MRRSALACRALVFAAAAVAAVACFVPLNATAQDKPAKPPAAAAPAAPVPATTPATAPSTAGKIGKLPFLEFDARTKQVRVECEALGVDMPLEFFAVVTNGPEHEALVRSKVKPSDLHTALLACGLKPGAPVTWVESANKWLPPHGPPLQISMEYEKGGRRVVEPASRWVRNVKTKRPMPITTWIFAGSRVMPDGQYAADATGYLVSVVNFDMTVIDIPDLASSSNEALEWVRNPDAAPPAGTKVTMLIEPAGRRDGAAGGGATSKPAAGEKAPAPTAPPAKQPSASAGDAGVNGSFGAPAPVAAAGAAAPAPREAANVATAVESSEITDAKLDEQLIARAEKKWNELVGPKANALREAAQAHYDTINAMRREQQRLIDEADRIQRAIDRLERAYQDMTTPQPDLDGDGTGDPKPEVPADAAE